MGLAPVTNLESLMWCMTGLEALFTKGREGISQQFRENIQATFGETQFSSAP